MNIIVARCSVSIAQCFYFGAVSDIRERKVGSFELKD